MSFDSCIAGIREKLFLKYPPVKTRKRESDKDRRLHLIEKIQLIVWRVMAAIAEDEFPAFNSTAPATWKNCCLDGKEIYYENPTIFKSQKQVDNGMKEISYLLNAPAWELRVSASSKGIVAGPVVLTLANGESVDCEKPGGVCVPQDVFQIEKISSSATWVLIIEKDACFQKMVATQCANKLGSCILITGKGFPDVNSRILVCKLWEHLQIPILVLTDADPHGFEIMCVYRFGSLSMSPYSGNLACPAVRWLGIHPSDIRPLLLDFKILSLNDRRKTQFLLKRDYVEKDENLKAQLEILLNGNVKAEIEGVNGISNNYLANVYIKNKIKCEEYL